MALNDFQPIEPAVPATEYDVKSGAAASIKAGEWVIKDGSNAGYVTVAADGASNADVWVGVAATTSTDTASADGKVMVYDDPDYTFEGVATTPANLAQAKVFTQVTLDVASSVQKVDENDTTNGTLIIQPDFDATTGRVRVKMATNDHVTAG